MKPSEIHVGATYSNGKEGRFYKERKVIAEGDFPLYEGQNDSDCVKYQNMSGLHRGFGSRMTRKSFAKWAKEKISD